MLLRRWSLLMALLLLALRSGGSVAATRKMFVVPDDVSSPVPRTAVDATTPTPSVSSGTAASSASSESGDEESAKLKVEPAVPTWILPMNPLSPFHPLMDPRPLTIADRAALRLTTVYDAYGVAHPLLPLFEQFHIDPPQLFDALSVGNSVAFLPPFHIQAYHPKHAHRAWTLRRKGDKKATGRIFLVPYPPHYPHHLNRIYERKYRMRPTRRMRGPVYPDTLPIHLRPVGYAAAVVPSNNVDAANNS